MNPLVVSWQTLDWAVLDRLRETFLTAKPAGAAYWTSPGDLANYDFTYARRIAWKWDAVLRELRLRGWTPPRGPLLDWGCGSGIASRRVLEFFGAEAFTALRVFDRSALAMEFAANAARNLFPALHVEPASPCWLDGDEPVGVLVVSHVLNELDEAGGAALRRVIDRADAVLWLEPGTHADSRALIAMRESLVENVGQASENVGQASSLTVHGASLPRVSGGQMPPEPADQMSAPPFQSGSKPLREQFHVIAPCTHQRACGLLTENNARHWCHHFAAPPVGIMADSDWVRFAQRAGIDLRSLPYSFLVLERRGLREPMPGQVPEGCFRVLGEPRVYKGFAKVLSCRASGVCELELQKRDAPEIFKSIKSGKIPALLHGEDDGRRFKTITALEE